VRKGLTWADSERWEDGVRTAQVEALRYGEGVEGEEARADTEVDSVEGDSIVVQSDGE